MTLHRNPYSQLLVSFQQSLISGRRSSVVFSVRRSLGNERIEPLRESDGMVIPIAGSAGARSVIQRGAKCTHARFTRTSPVSNAQVYRYIDIDRPLSSDRRGK